VGTSLITIRETGQCLGDLFHAQGKGTFCPDNGKVPVGKEAADVHNKALDEAKLEGLDERCEIGQGGMFYWTDGQVKTFLGTQVNEGHVVTSGKVRKTVHFTRKGKKFKGVLRPTSDCFWAKRIA
jgi:hypothetical protein